MVAYLGRKFYDTLYIFIGVSWVWALQNPRCCAPGEIGVHLTHPTTEATVKEINMSLSMI